MPRPTHSAYLPALNTTPLPLDQRLLRTLAYNLVPVADSDSYGAFQAKYWADPAAFMRECILWPNPSRTITDYQAEIAQSILVKKRVSVRGPHGLGKSTLAALLTLWFALTRDGRDWKIITTASAWRQLESYLWPEIHKWIARLDWTRIGRPPLVDGREVLQLSLKLDTGQAFGVASNNHLYIEGAHADHLFYIFDEAKAIPAATWDAAEGAFSGAGDDLEHEALALAISTPGEPTGRFYDIHARRPGLEDWYVRHVKLDESIAAGRISRTWADQRKALWGETSALYQNRVLGEFAEQAADTVIPLAWVEKANDRWSDWVKADKPGRFICVGVDVGRGGDRSVFAKRYEADTVKAIDDLLYESAADTMVVAGRVKGILDKYGGQAVVDVIGIGAGVVDRLREQEYTVTPFNAGERAEGQDKSGELGFVNKRSHGWWNLRELLDPNGPDAVALPPDDLLTGDLCAPRWKATSGGRIQVESKDTIKERLGRSTDSGDAVMMAFASEGTWWVW